MNGCLHLDTTREKRFLWSMKLLILACQIALFAPLLAKEFPADALLDKIISQPGSYSQVCDVVTVPEDVPYRAFQITDFAGASFSKKNQELIDKNREILVKAIRKRLLEIDFSRETKQPAEDPAAKEEESDGDPYGADPKSLNPLLLTMIQQLHAIEALPELLEIEKKLVAEIAKAKDNASAKPPVTYGWFVSPVSENYEDNEPEAKRERRLSLFHSRVAQRDLVMTMAVLMREKKYEPYLKTSLENSYVKGLKRKVEKDKIPQFKKDEVSANEIDDEIAMDPVSGIFHGEYTSISIPYTRESRDEIRAAAAQWISEHP